MAEENETTNQPQTKQPLLKYIIIGLLVLIIGAGGFIGWTMLAKGNKKEAVASEPQLEEKKASLSIIHELESFIVNLQDRSGMGKRYLKVSIGLEVGSETAKKKIESHIPQIRDAFLLLLSNQTVKDVHAMEGKLELKQSLLMRANQVLGESVISRVYFSEFVVQ